jgi:predicted small secreted protein
MNNFRVMIGPLRTIALALSAIAVSGCINTLDGAAADESSKVHSIVLSAPSDSELATLRGGSKSEPLRVGIGRSVPTSESRVALNKLSWQRVASDSYTATISLQSVGAKSIRAGLRLSAEVPSLVLSFDGSDATLRSSAIVSTNGSDVYWSPVLAGDTLKIVLTARTPPTSNVVLEIPVVSHIP